ncbi:MAG: hypothetical protein Ct9H300mP5_3480 [Candidatus Pelagibacterales bacterium]|nr:MAG: hypothetical protein Ct9H300mP5_3480 [Pelagibacterales bacterium]
MKVFVKLTNPILDFFKFLTPSFLVRAIVPLYSLVYFYDKILLITHLLGMVKWACFLFH